VQTWPRAGRASRTDGEHPDINIQNSRIHQQHVVPVTKAYNLLRKGLKQKKEVEEKLALEFGVQRTILQLVTACLNSESQSINYPTCLQSSASGLQTN
jgi:hypothetical protein